MKLSVSAYRAHALAHKKILSGGYHSHFKSANAIAAPTVAASTASSTTGLYTIDNNSGLSSEMHPGKYSDSDSDVISDSDSSSSSDIEQSQINPSYNTKQVNNSFNDSSAYSLDKSGPNHRKSHFGDGNSDPDSDGVRTNQRWMKLRTTVQISSAIQKKPALKREDSFLKRFSTRHISDAQEAVEDSGSEGVWGATSKERKLKQRQRYLQRRLTVVNPDENFYFYWLMLLTVCVLYNLWTLIVRQSFPELQQANPSFWLICDSVTDVVFVIDILVQLRTGYLEQGLMVYDDKKLASHYMYSKNFLLDLLALVPFDLLQMKIGVQPLLRFPRFFKAYRSIRFYYIVESRTVWPNLWRVINLIHILLILAHWFGCFYYLLSEAEGFQGDWVYPYRPGDYATLTRKYLGSLYWSTLTLTTIGDLPTPETNAEYMFTIVSYLIGVFIFATIVGQVGNVITNRNANRLEFERLLDGAKTYMRHHKVPGGMKRRVLRWYDYSWSRGRMQGGGDINTALGLLPDKLKTELALHVNLSVLKKVTIFQECQPEFLHDLVLKMKAYIFTPGDSICRKGEVAREMFIIADGILEVLSETGKVLTTMKAGDFFGEIGILNLDGLNKRTADVRSVGYSELFSLSREDVLAAMKDYPEAQEILQTLGRKRLKEVRCVNKKYAKLKTDKDPSSPGSNQLLNQSTSTSETIPRNRPNKFKQDNKQCLKSSFRKTKIFRRNSDQMYADLFTDKVSKTEVKISKEEFGLQLDDRQKESEQQAEYHEKAISKIGAGLPLLQRLRLLKEQQDREDRAVRTTPTTQNQATPYTHLVMCPSLSSQESIQEEPEHEASDDVSSLNIRQQCHKSISNTSLPPITTQLPVANSSSNTIRTEDISLLKSNLDTPLRSSPNTHINTYCKHKSSALTSSSCTNLIGSNSFPLDASCTSNALAHTVLLLENQRLDQTNLEPFKNNISDDSHKQFYPQLCSNIASGPIDSYHRFRKTEYYKSLIDLSSGRSYKNRLSTTNHSTVRNAEPLSPISKIVSLSENSTRGPKKKLPQKPLCRSQSVTFGISRQHLQVGELDSGTSTRTSTSTSDNSKNITNYNIPPGLDVLKHEYLPLDLEVSEAIERNQLDVNYNQLSNDVHKLSGLSKDEGIDVLFKSSMPQLTPTVVDNYPTLLNSISSNNGSHVKPVNYHGSQQLADHLLTSSKVAEQQSLKEILIGINNTVRIHIKDMQSKFRSQFSSMAEEVQRRDMIIARLQEKVHDLELNVMSSASRKRCHWKPCKHRDSNNRHRSSSVSSDELLFMRHDSLDTVFTTSSPFKTLKRVNTNHVIAKHNSKAEEYQLQLDITPVSNSSKKLQNMKLANDSVVLDIGSSTSSNSSFERLHRKEVAESSFMRCKRNFLDLNRVYHDDWEIKMLAAEIAKRKRAHSLSDHLPVPIIRHRSTSL